MKPSAALAARRDATLRRMMADSGLPESARVWGFHVYAKGPGEHEIHRSEFVALLTLPDGKEDVSEDTIRRHLTALRAGGYIASRRNGRRPPLYTFAPALDKGETTVDPLSGKGSNDLDPATHKGSKAPAEPVDPLPDKGENFDPAPGKGSSVDPAPGKGSNAPPRVRGIPLREEQIDVGDDDEERASAGAAVCPEAESLIVAECDTLSVAADALRHYLRTRVPPANHLGYVRGVVGLLQPMGTFNWSFKTGVPCAAPHRPVYVRDALDELSGSTEAKGHRRPVGDLANLKTKIGILLRPVESADPQPQTDDGDDLDRALAAIG